MNNATIVQIVSVLGCVGLISASSLLVPRINQTRNDLNMVGTEEVVENTPPEYVFAIQALGAFRSLITDIAFMRAERFKEQGRYYDAMQLHTWICKLQPRFQTVWEYSAWNMAWNISVTTFTPEERWNWVYSGAKLLRDQGLRYNPRGLNMYKQLAWIFVNKMGETIDDYHWAYKSNWAWRMHLVLGAPPDPELDDLDGDVKPMDIDDPLLQAARRASEMVDAKRRAEAEREGWRYIEREVADVSTGVMHSDEFLAAKQAAYDFIKRVDDAPDSLATLYEQFPESKPLVARMRAAGINIPPDDERVTEEMHFAEDGLAWSFFYPYRRVIEPITFRKSIEKESATPAPEFATVPVETLRELLGYPDMTPAADAVVRYLQRRVLVDVYKLDPAQMVYVVQQFGPVDWRLCSSHSLYWVTQALIKGGETVHDFQNDRTNTSRLLFFSLRNLFQRNKFVFEPLPEDIHRSYIDFGIDVNFIESLQSAFLSYGRYLDPRPTEDTQGEGVGDIYRVGHINFLTEGIITLYLLGREDEAEYYLSYLRETYGRNPDGSVRENYAKNLADYVRDNLEDILGTQRAAFETVAAVLDNAYEQLTDGRIRQYNKTVEKAKEFHEMYMQDVREDLGDRRKMPPFRDLQIDRLNVKLASLGLTANLVVRKARLWARAPLNMKQYVYDERIEQFQYECDQLGFDVAKAFPEPPGMAQFRKDHPERARQERERTAETTVQPSFE